MRFRPADRQATAGTAALIDATRAIMALPPARPLTLHLRRAGVDHNRSVIPIPACRSRFEVVRSEEHTSELPSVMRNSYAVFCLTKQNESQLKHTNDTPS